jgi:hypothetical protein
MVVKDEARQTVLFLPFLAGSVLVNVDPAPIWEMQLLLHGGMTRVALPCPLEAMRACEYRKNAPRSDAGRSREARRYFQTFTPNDKSES